MSFPSSDPKGYYAVLGLRNTASPEDVKKAYHQRAKELHPDHNPSPDATIIFQNVAEAYRVLSDPDRKSFYDAQCQGKKGGGRSFRGGSTSYISRHPRVLWCAIAFSIGAFLLTLGVVWWPDAGDAPGHRQDDRVVVAGDTRLPPALGELRHVQTDRLRVYQKPDKTSPLLTVLERFSTVQIIALTEYPDWVVIRTPEGVSGHAQIYALFPGPGDGPKSRRCWDNLDAPAPANGAVLLRRGMGTRPLDIRNLSKSDALVKLKSGDGVTYLTVFVQAGTEITVSGVPDDVPLRAVFATGRDYSPGCIAFLTNFSAYSVGWRLHTSDRTAPTLVLSLSFATDLPVEQFLSDE